MTVSDDDLLALARNVNASPRERAIASELLAARMLVTSLSDALPHVDGSITARVRAFASVHMALAHYHLSRGGSG